MFGSYDVTRLAGFIALTQPMSFHGSGAAVGQTRQPSERVGSVEKQQEGSNGRRGKLKAAANAQ